MAANINSVEPKKEAISIAKNLWEEYKNLHIDIRKDNLVSVQKKIIEINGATDIAAAADVYDLSVSRFQGAKAHKGRLVNKLIEDGYSEFFGDKVIEIFPEYKIGDDGKRDVDLYIRLPGGELFITITTIPQERKDATWREEKNVIYHMMRNSKSRRKYRFVPIFCEAGNGVEVNKTIEKRERLENLVGDGCEVVALQDFPHHAEFLRKTLAEFS